MTWNITLSDIDMGAEEAEAVQQVLHSKWLTMGAVTQQFEQEFAAFIGAKHAIAVCNGTAALHLACVANNIQPGDEVIVPSLTFVATANAARYCGAVPVFADVISPDNLNISPLSIRERITPKTRAIIVMHYGGYPCDMPAIMEIAAENNLAVIEDAAHAPGSSLDGTKMGTWGSANCFSLFSNKNLTTGEGGMITTNDDTLAQRLRRLRSHGMTTMTLDRHKGHAWSYDVVELGYNYRIDEIRSAFGLVQLHKLEKSNHRRRHLSERYRALLHETCPQVILPFLNHPGISAAHLMPMVLPAGTNRQQVMEFLKANGIQTSIHYPPIHQFSAYTRGEFNIPPLPITEDAASRELTLPLYPGLTDENVRFVVQTIQHALSEQQP